MITLTILGTVITLSILTLVLAGIVLLSVLIGLLWRLNRYLHQQAVKKSQQAMKRIVPQMKLEHRVLPSHQAWVETLLENNLLTPLFSPGRYMILGTPAMGSTAILSYVVSTINSSFAKDGRMCIYVDVGEFARPTRGMGYVSMEEIYRSIIWSGVQLPVKRLQTHISKSSFQRTGLDPMLKEIDGILKSGLTRMSPLAVRQSTVEVWNRLGIREVVFAIENLTQLDPATTPVLLELLQQTFGRIASVSYIIAANPATLVLNKKTEDGRIGLQISHDVRIAFNLEHLLISQPGLGREDNTVRLNYLARLIQPYPINEVSNRDRSAIRGLFSPPETWKLVFDRNKGNLVEIDATLEKLIEHYNSSGNKIDPATLQKMLRGKPKGLEPLPGGQYA
jgi:hypothetical protein